MQWITSNNVNYGLIKDNDIKDNIPEWMDDSFFQKLQEEPKKVNVGGIYLNKKRDLQCASCGTTLANNEVIYCSSCRSKMNMPK